MSKILLKNLRKVRRYITFENASLGGFMNSPRVISIKESEVTEFVKEHTRLYFQTPLWHIDEMIKQLELKQIKAAERKKRRKS